MKSIGKSAAAVVERAAKAAALPPTRSAVPSLPAIRSADGLPVRYDSEVDFQIPARVYCAWVPSSGRREVVRPLTEAERTKVAGRAAALREALAGYPAGDGPQVEAEIAVMFSGFRALRQQDEDVAATVAVTCRVVREFPLWAIARACLMISQDRAGLDRRYAPNDSEFTDVVASIVKSYRRALASAEDLLAAPVERAPNYDKACGVKARER